MILTLCLESEQHTTDQSATFLAEMVYFSKNAFFLCLAIWQKHVYIIYTMILMPAMNSALYCCRYLPCIYIYALFDKSIFFTIDYVSGKYVFDIEQTWVQFLVANSAFSEKCSASFHSVHECFSEKNMSRLNMHFFKR